MCLRLAIGMARGPEGVVVGVGVGFVCWSVGVTVGVVGGLVTTCSPGRGVKTTGTLRPVEARAVVICRLKVVLACKTRISTTTSAFGLSRSLMIFEARATRS